MHLNDIFLKPELQRVRGRFRSFVPDYLGSDDCWEWTGKRKKRPGKDYGLFTASESPRRTFTASRIAYVLANGPFPDYLNGQIACVLHRCDNPPCCNPAHLFLGTQRDNIDDMMSKGRSLRGAKHGRTSITEEQATAIINSSKPAKEAAEEFGVKVVTLTAIRSGKSFKHLAHLPRPKLQYAHPGRRHLTPEQVAAIRADTRPRKPIAEEYGIKVRQVGKIRLGYQWKNT